MIDIPKDMPVLNKAFDEEYIKYREAFPKEYDVPAIMRSQDRNVTLEEVAKEIEKMTAFGQDTLASFAVYIRNMKTGDPSDQQDAI